MKIRKRIPILDDLIEACRFLPQMLQAILFTFLGAASFSLFMLGIQHLLWAILFFEILFLLILIQKNFLYRRLSKMEKVVSHQVIWVKTKEDVAQIPKYLILSIVFSIITLVLSVYFFDLLLIITLSLICVLFFLKGIFYVPDIYIKIDEKQQLEIVNARKKERITAHLSHIKAFHLTNRQIKLVSLNEEITRQLNFAKKEDYDKLNIFLRRIPDRTFSVVN